MIAGNQPVKIAFIEQDSRIGGAEINLLCLLERLPSDKYKPIVVCPFEGPLTEKLKENGQRWAIVNVPSLYSVSTRILGRKIANPAACVWDIAALAVASGVLKKWLMKEGIEIVHTNSIFSHLYGSRAARLAGIPCVWHLQDIYDPSRAFGLFNKMIRSAAKKYSPLVVAISQPVSQVVNGIDVPVKLVPNGVVLEDYQNIKREVFRLELGISPAQTLIGIVGRVTVWKGQKDFVQAALNIAPKFPQAVFVVVGDAGFDNQDYFQEVRKLADSKELNGRIFFTGFREDIPEIMAALDILVLASQEPEPFGRVVIEAMAAETAVVATRGGGVSEILEEGKTGLLVAPCSPEEIAQAVAILLSDRSLRESLAFRAKAAVFERYSIDRFVEGMLSAYEEALKFER